MLVLKKIREYAKTGRTALVNRDERMTFAELDARSEAFAAWLLGWFGNDRAPVVICGEKESNFLPNYRIFWKPLLWYTTLELSPAWKSTAVPQENIRKRKGRKPHVSCWKTWDILMS